MVVGATVSLLARIFHLRFSQEAIAIQAMLSLPGAVMGGAMAGWVAWYSWEDRKARRKRDDK